MSGRSSAGRLVCALAALLTLLISISAADAKPRKVSNGCTVQQIASVRADACLNQMSEDIRLGRAAFHALYCNSAGNMLCCVFLEGVIQAHSCETVPGMSRPDQGVFNPGLTGGSNDPGPSPPSGPGGPIYDPSLTIY